MRSAEGALPVILITESLASQKGLSLQSVEPFYTFFPVESVKMSSMLVSYWQTLNINISNSLTRFTGRGNPFKKSFLLSIFLMLRLSESLVGFLVAFFDQPLRAAWTNWRILPPTPLNFPHEGKRKARPLFFGWSLSSFSQNALKSASITIVSGGPSRQSW